MGIVGTVRIKEKKTSAGASETFVSEPVKIGQIWEIDHLSVSDYTTAGKVMSLGIRDVSNSDHYIITESGTALRGVFLTGKVLLYEGERLVGIVASATSSDVCYFTASGLIYDAKQMR